MFNTVELAAYFITNDYRKDLSDAAKGKDGENFVESFSVLLKRVWSDNNNQFLVPKDFKMWFEKAITRIFHDEDTQYDAQEFNEFLIDGFRENLNSNRPNETSEIKRIFFGKYAITRCCSCEGKVYEKSFEEFRHLALVPQKLCSKKQTKFYKLEDMLNVISSPQTERNGTCDDCEKPINQTKTISELPPVLILQINRNGESKKILNKVEFPVNDLDMGKFVPGLNGKAKYNLYATCNHIGRGYNSGHYEASCKNINEDVWYNFNDHHPFTEMKQAPTFNDSKYVSVLFYSNSDRSDYKDTILKPQL